VNVVYPMRSSRIARVTEARELEVGSWQLAGDPACPRNADAGCHGLRAAPSSCQLPTVNCQLFQEASPFRPRRRRDHPAPSEDARRTDRIARTYSARRAAVDVIIANARLAVRSIAPRQRERKTAAAVEEPRDWLGLMSMHLIGARSSRPFSCRGLAGNSARLLVDLSKRKSSKSTQLSGDGPIEWTRAPKFLQDPWSASTASSPYNYADAIVLPVVITSSSLRRAEDSGYSAPRGDVESHLPAHGLNGKRSCPWSSASAATRWPR
jgi:hypothetical protein